MASSSGTATEKKKIILVSSDGHTFEIDEDVAEHSLTIKNMIEDGCADNPIPLPNVASETLAKVIEYCKRLTKAPDTGAADSPTQQPKTEFPNLFELILAANYLNIKSLLDDKCQSVADQMKGMSVEEVRKLFNIENDYTKEEEDDVRNENPWVFEEN
ncbi:hypothetical protein ACP275_02G007200 [Erythranthe tilingii]